MLYYNNVYRQLSDIGCFLCRSGVVLVLDVVGCKVNTFFSNSQIFRPFLFSSVPASSAPEKILCQIREYLRLNSPIISSRARNINKV